MESQNRKFFTASVALAGMAFFGAQPALAATVFQYNFEGGPNGANIASLVDSGPNGLNGTTFGLKYSNAVAPGGGSFAADASGDFNYASVADSVKLHLQNFNLSLLFNPTGSSFDPSGNHAGNLVTKKWGEVGNYLDSYGLYYNSTTGKVSGDIAFGGGAGLFVVSTDSFAVGSGWHSVQLALTRDFSGTQDKLELFVDGKVQGSSVGNFAPIIYAGSDLVIGASNFGCSTCTYRYNFNGLIDRVSLSNTPVVAVPEPETYALMLAGLGLFGFLGRGRKK
mgnify:CR=1 FL=1